MADDTATPTVPGMDPARRNAVAVTAAVGAVGAVGAAVPFVSSMRPSERARAAAAPVEVDIAGMQPGELRRVEWRGMPVWIVRRNEQMIKSLQQTENQVLDPQSNRTYQFPIPEYARNQHRSIKPEYLVVIGICSHLGCSPVERFAPGPQPSLPADWVGGFFCPCHGSMFDLAGRVWRNVPANANLDVPPHTFLSDTRLLIGEDKA
ncbi:MAG TPA: ubiquinol-cytochrome c reductase iron-sulfur subunit [Burkholderiaceae bacterium]|nr:ubiquinol-cytochrome c reductase iron-sulfur subunit [Burkholderiaceae bacterium]